MNKKIPCLDLQGQHQQVKAEIFEAFEKVYAKTAFSGGPFVEEFENAYASFLGVKHVIGVSNGTTALHLAMLALGIGNGDEVIIPANTFIATAWGPSHAGATPVFVDCNADTWEIDAAKIEAAITKKTKAVIGVHLYGQPFDVDAVSAICKKHNLFLIEDTAQAQGAKFNGVIVGGKGDVACYSFYPGKNLGACGEAGAVVTNNDELAKHMRSLRNHGSTVRYYHDEIGYNYRMGGLEGASLSVKLKYLTEWNNKRKHIAHRYQTEVKNPKIKMQQIPNGSDGIYHLFVVTVADKDQFVDYLAKNNITAAFHYPVPCHLQKAYSHLNYKQGDFPNSEYLASHCVSLPMYAEMSVDDINIVIDTLNNF